MKTFNLRVHHLAKLNAYLTYFVPDKTKSPVLPAKKDYGRKMYRKTRKIFSAIEHEKEGVLIKLVIGEDDMCNANCLKRASCSKEANCEADKDGIWFYNLDIARATRDLPRISADKEYTAREVKEMALCLRIFRY